MRNRICLLLFFLTLAQFGFAAGDHYDNIGKMRTVVICVAVILVGITLFLFYLERRVSKMEQSIEDQRELNN